MHAYFSWYKLITIANEKMVQMDVATVLHFSSKHIQKCTHTETHTHKHTHTCMETTEHAHTSYKHTHTSMVN